MAATTPTLSQTSQQPGAALTNSSSLSRPRPSMAPPRVPLPRASVDQPDKAANGGEKQMDLPVDKARILRSYDAARKWELVLDRERVTDHGAPRIYVDKLATFLADNKKTANKKKQKKLLGTETSTGVLKHLEISLRTNSINWVHEFLADECNGLKVLVEYMKLIQDTGGLQEPPPYTHDPSLASTSMDNGHSSLPNGTDSSSFSSQEKKHGFNMVLADPEAIYCIARSILHHSMRTKAMTLELLAAICLVKGGHELVTTAFDRFKWEYQERDRFQTLMAYFRHPPEFHIDFMVFCMQFINIVVHSVQDMNHRVFMQHEFTRLGLDDMLEELCDDESELRVQMQAYKNNMYDVNTLCQDAKLKDELFVEKEELESELSRSRERQQEMEANYMVRSLELDRRVNELKRERDSFAARHQETNNEVHTLRRTLNTQEKSAIEKQRAMEQRIRELENVQESLKSGLQAARSPAPAGSDAPSREPLTVSVQQADAHSDRDSSGRGSAESGVPADGHHRSSGIWQQGGAAPPPPPNVPPPPPPPPPSALAGIPAAPPPPPPSAGFLAGGPNTSEDVMTIKPKRRVETKHKLPMFNWSALKPNQVKDTIFSVLDDDKIMPDIDFAHLEEYFRVSQSGGMQRGAPAGGVRVLPPSGAQQHVSNGALHASPEHKAGACAKKPCLLDVKRLQNVGISRRRLAMSADEVMCAVHRLDLHALSPEQLECLQRIAPQEDELKSFREYENSGKPLDALTDEEQFVMKLCKIERLQHKLNVMSFMANFEETVDLVEPQFTALTAASGCVRDATKLHRLLEVILAYGNYMNSARRGGVYGFRLQSLDTLSLLRSPVDKSLTLLHLITETVREHFPDLLDFDEQLKFIDKASTICLEALSTDCRELEAGYALAQREHALKAHDCPPTLVTFLRTADERIGRLRDASKLAQESYASCADFYGEPTSNRPQPAAFFSILTNFVRNFKHADADNLQRAKEVERERVEQERKAARAARQQRQGGASPNKPNLHSPNGDADSELEAKLNAVFKSSQARARGGRSTSNERSTGRLTVRSRDELGHGALDDIISSLREEPYVVFEGGGGQTANGAPNGSSVVGGNRSRTSLAGRRCLPTDVHRER